MAINHCMNSLDTIPTGKRAIGVHPENLGFYEKEMMIRALFHYLTPEIRAKVARDLPTMYAKLHTLPKCADDVR